MKSSMYILFSCFAFYGCNTPKNERFVEPIIYTEYPITEVLEPKISGLYLEKNWRSEPTGWNRLQIVERATGITKFEYEYTIELGQSRVLCDDNSQKCDYLFYYVEKNFPRAEHCIIAPLNYEGKIRDNPVECR